ncbi:MAG: hypothetical protein WCX47_05085 [Bacilli bacterium]
MKTKFTIILGLAALLALSGCNGESNLSQDSLTSGDDSNPTSTVDGLAPQPGEEIYEDKLIYDLGAEAPYNVSVRVELDQEISGVRSGRVRALDTEFAYNEGILTLAGSFLTQIGSGEKDLELTLADESLENVPAIFATKVIKTAQEFQDINNNLTGIYVLGNDIDLGTIAYFQPLGYFYDETNINNEYFHGILEGNGHTVSNARVYYASSTTSSEDAYYGDSMFTDPAHQSGNNIGLFQIIGSSGIVRNVHFDSIRVRARTIAGVIAGNNSGLIENCLVTNSKVQMGTHFYDNDCNAGGVVGIVAASGIIRNTVTLMGSGDITLPNTFMDYSDDYVGKEGNGWDHSADPNNTDPWWQFANVDRPLMSYDENGENPVDTGTKEIDSNGSRSNGMYAFAGKTWGLIENSFALGYTITPYESTARPINFTQTHLTSVKPKSGTTDMGSVTNSGTKTMEELQQASLYADYDPNIWEIVDGYDPELQSPIIHFTLAE